MIVELYTFRWWLFVEDILLIQYQCTPGSPIMRIHLVRNWTSARFENNSKIFTWCKFIQLVGPIIHLVLNNIHLLEIEYTVRDQRFGANKILPGFIKIVPFWLSSRIQIHQSCEIVNLWKKLSEIMVRLCASNQIKTMNSWTPPTKNWE